MRHACAHIARLTDLVDPIARECEECVSAGSSWVHLRTCQSCGATLCCDSSPNQHMTRHFEATGHPVIRSAEPGDDWVWCYEHKQFARTGTAPTYDG